MSTTTMHTTAHRDDLVTPAPTTTQLLRLAADIAAGLVVRTERDGGGDAGLHGVRRVLTELVGAAPAGSAVPGDDHVVVAREVAAMLRRLGRTPDLPAAARRRAAAELVALASDPVIG